MAAAILEIQDDVAVGPIHHPIKQDASHNVLNEDEFPLEWNSLCGVRGFVYQREALKSHGYTKECFECRVLAIKGETLPVGKPKPAKTRQRRPDFFVAGPSRYKTEEERKAARSATYRRRYERRRGTCQDCGKTSAPKSIRCRACHFEWRRSVFMSPAQPEQLPFSRVNPKKAA